LALFASEWPSCFLSFCRQLLSGRDELGGLLKRLGHPDGPASSRDEGLIMCKILNLIRQTVSAPLPFSQTEDGLACGHAVKPCACGAPLRGFAASGPDRMTEPSQGFLGRKRLVAGGIAFLLSGAQPDIVRQIKS
jgi:hypothetical protein